MPRRKRQPGRPPGRIRIIAGRFRSRQVPVPALDGLRPTGDRVRETLFNWLAPHLPGARCLDLFAGTGALALEAASRGASRVVAVERDRELARGLRDLAADWGADEVEVLARDALAVLAGPVEAFDIAFLDPPFGGDLADRAIERLCDGWLAPGARVYVETGAGDRPRVPADWQVLRERTAGQVTLRLFAAP